MRPVPVSAELILAVGLAAALLAFAVLISG